LRYQENLARLAAFNLSLSKILFWYAQAYQVEDWYCWV